MVKIKFHLCILIGHTAAQAQTGETTGSLIMLSPHCHLAGHCMLNILLLYYPALPDILLSDFYVHAIHSTRLT